MNKTICDVPECGNAGLFQLSIIGPMNDKMAEPIGGPHGKPVCGTENNLGGLDFDLCEDHWVQMGDLLDPLKLWL